MDKTQLNRGEPLIDGLGAELSRDIILDFVSVARSSRNQASESTRPMKHPDTTHVSLDPLENVNAAKTANREEPEEPPSVVSAEDLQALDQEFVESCASVEEESLSEIIANEDQSREPPTLPSVYAIAPAGDDVDQIEFIGPPAPERSCVDDQREPETIAETKEMTGHEDFVEEQAAVVENLPSEEKTSPSQELDAEPIFTQVIEPISAPVAEQEEMLPSDGDGVVVSVAQVDLEPESISELSSSSLSAVEESADAAIAVDSVVQPEPFETEVERHVWCA